MQCFSVYSTIIKFCATSVGIWGVAISILWVYARGKKKRRLPAGPIDTENHI